MSQEEPAARFLYRRMEEFAAQEFNGRTRISQENVPDYRVLVIAESQPGEDNPHLALAFADVNDLNQAKEDSESDSPWVFANLVYLDFREARMVKDAISRVFPKA